MRENYIKVWNKMHKKQSYRLRSFPVPLHITLMFFLPERTYIWIWTQNLDCMEFCGGVVTSGQCEVELGWKWPALSQKPLKETVGYLFNVRVASWNALAFQSNSFFLFFSRQRLKNWYFSLSIHLAIYLSKALHNPSTPSFPPCHLFLTSFLSFQWLTLASEGYLCLQGSVRNASVCETEKRHVCVCHSICSYMNSHFPPEQTHFPNTHLTHESQQGHTHTRN